MNPQSVREYHVPSSRDPRRTYLVAEDADGRLDCDCPDRRYRRNHQCKHVVAVQSGRVLPEQLTGQVIPEGARLGFRRTRGGDLLWDAIITEPAVA